MAEKKKEVKKAEPVEEKAEKNLAKAKQGSAETGVQFSLNLTTLVAVLVGLLLVVSAFQAFQLVSLNNEVDQQSAKVLELQGVVSGGVAEGSQLSGGQPSGGGSGNLPANLTDLPDMVGGC